MLPTKFQHKTITCIVYIPLRLSFSIFRRDITRYTTT
jgi:hypothetical protein